MGGQPGRAAPRSLTGEPGGWPPGTVPEKETDERAKILLRVAELYKERTDGLAALITRETGKPTQEAKGEIALAVSAYRHYPTRGRRSRWPASPPRT